MFLFQNKMEFRYWRHGYGGKTIETEHFKIIFPKECSEADINHVIEKDGLITDIKVHDRCNFILLDKSQIRTKERKNPYDKKRYH